MCCLLLYTPISRWIFSSAKSYKTFFYTSHIKLWTPFMQHNFFKIIFESDKNRNLCLEASFVPKSRRKINTKNEAQSSPFVSAHTYWSLFFEIEHKMNGNPALKQQYRLSNEGTTSFLKVDLIQPKAHWSKVCIHTCIGMSCDLWPILCPN